MCGLCGVRAASSFPLSHSLSLFVALSVVFWLYIFCHKYIIVTISSIATISIIVSSHCFIATLFHCFTAAISAVIACITGVEFTNLRVVYRCE